MNSKRFISVSFVVVLFANSSDETSTAAPSLNNGTVCPAYCDERGRMTAGQRCSSDEFCCATSATVRFCCDNETLDASNAYDDVDSTADCPATAPTTESSNAAWELVVFLVAPILLLAAVGAAWWRNCRKTSQSCRKGRSEDDNDNANNRQPHYHHHRHHHHPQRRQQQQQQTTTADNQNSHRNRYASSSSSSSEQNSQQVTSSLEQGVTYDLEVNRQSSSLPDYETATRDLPKYDEIFDEGFVGHVMTSSADDGGADESTTRGVTSSTDERSQSDRRLGEVGAGGQVR